MNRNPDLRAEDGGKNVTLSSFGDLPYKLSQCKSCLYLSYSQ